MGGTRARELTILAGLLIAGSTSAASEQLTAKAVDTAVAETRARIQRCEGLVQQPGDRLRRSCIRECTDALDRAARVRRPHTPVHRTQFESATQQCIERFELATARLASDGRPLGLARMSPRDLDRAAQEAATYLKNCDFYAGSTSRGRPSSCHQSCQAYMDGITAIRQQRVTEASTTDGLERTKTRCRESYEQAIAAYRERPQSKASAPAVAREQAPRPAPVRCERRLTGKLCIEAEARAARASRALLGSLGGGQITDDVIRQGDRAEAADRDATGVLRTSGDSTVFGCNRSDERKRVASLRWSCVPSAVIYQDGYQCDLHFSGWAEFEGQECKALKFNGPSLMLAVYGQEADGSWEPVIYSFKDDEAVDFDSAVRQPVPSLRPMLEAVCGHDDRDFYLSLVDQIHPKPRCSDGRDPIILNLSIRAPDKSARRARFEVGF